MAEGGRKNVVINYYVTHPLIANKYILCLTVLLPFCNFRSTQRGCLTSKLFKGLALFRNVNHERVVTVLVTVAH